MKQRETEGEIVWKILKQKQKREIATPSKKVRKTNKLPWTHLRIIIKKIEDDKIGAKKREIVNRDR